MEHPQLPRHPQRTGLASGPGDAEEPAWWPNVHRQLSWRLNRSLRSLPGLLDQTAAPCDVLSVSVAVHRVLDEDHGAKQYMRHCNSSPAELASMGSYGGPAARAWRRGARQVAWLVFLFVVLDTSKSLAVSWAAVHGHMCAPLVIGAKNALSIGFGMALAGCLDGAVGVRQCLDFRRALKVLPIAGSFCAAQIFALQALRAFDAGSLKVIAQVNLPATALLSWVVLGRRYSGRQWLAVMLLLVATTAFLQVRMLFFEPKRGLEQDEDLLKRAPDKVIGMLYFLAGIALSCCASIFAERFLKKRYDIPFYIQKTNLMLGELFSACFMVHLNVRNHDVGDICSWEQIRAWRQLPVILIWFIHGWIAGLLVKRCSALVKNISHILSALVTYFLPLLYAEEGEHSWPVTLSALLVLIAVLVYATVPAVRSKESRPLRLRGVPLEERPLRRANSEASMRQLQLQLPPSPKGHRHFRSGEPPGTPRQPTEMKTLAPPLEPRLRAASQPPFRDAALPHGMARRSVWCLVLCFILLDATKPLLVTWATAQKAPEERFILGTFVLVQTSLSLLVGLVLAAAPSFSLCPPRAWLHPEWTLRVRRCLEPVAVFHRLPVSGCLCLSKFLLMMALGRLDAGTVRVFGQASLPLVGVSSALFFSKRYTLQQWCSLVAISIALITFYYVKAEVQHKKEVSLERPPSQRLEVVGVCLILASIGFNCLGALFVEKFLKGNQSRLHVQKAQLLLGEVVVNAALIFAVPFFHPDPEQRAANSPWIRGFFAGWDGRVLLCAVVWIPAGWTTTMLVKRCSNLLKTIAQSSSSVLTYVFTVLPLHSGPRFWSYLVTLLGPPLTPEPLSSPVVLLAVTVMLAAITFGTDSAASNSRGKAARGTPRQPSWEQEQEGRLEGGLAKDQGLNVVGESAISDWKMDPAYRQLPQQRKGPHAGREEVPPLEDHRAVRKGSQ